MSETAPSGDKPVGGTTETCPLKVSTALIQVIRADTGEIVGGANVTLTGPTPGSGVTGSSDGIKQFDSLKKGKYKVEVTLEGDFKDKFDPPENAYFAVSHGVEKVIVMRIDRITTWIEIELVGEDNKGIPGELYKITLPDGKVQEGRLDSRGRARLEGMDPGKCKVEFPNLDKDAWETKS